MRVSIERYSDEDHSEIKLQLPQGECFILADKADKNGYEVSVLVPWYGKRFYTGIDSTILYDQLESRIWQQIMNAPTSDLIAIIRKALPAIRRQNQEASLDI